MNSPIKISNNSLNLEPSEPNNNMTQSSPWYKMLAWCICGTQNNPMTTIIAWWLVFAARTFTWFMMTASNGNIFRVTGHLCGNSPVTGEFPSQRPMTRSFDVFIDLRVNKRLSKRWGGWGFETTSRPLWHNCNVKGDGQSLSLVIAYDYQSCAHVQQSFRAPRLSCLASW